MQLLKKILAIVLVLCIVYMLGPKPQTPVYKTELPNIPANTVALINYVAANEAIHKISPIMKRGLFGQTIRQKIKQNMLSFIYMDILLRRKKVIRFIEI
jgi:hypothetical protein